MSGRRGEAASPRAARSGVRYLFACWPEISSRLRAATSVALFTDFDGTLVRIQPRSESVRLPQAGRRLLARLARHPRIELWIVSGRRLADIRRRVGPVGARLAGLHGWEREDGVPLAGVEMDTLRGVAKSLREQLRRLRGVRFEDKKWGLAIHYRGAGGLAVRQAWGTLRDVLRDSASPLCLLPGKMVWEILPCKILSRGKAIRNLLANEPPGTLPVYIGDDSTDELAFRALRRGVTVHVGTGRMTRARYYLRSPGEVMTFLKRMEREVS